MQGRTTKKTTMTEEESLDRTGPSEFLTYMHGKATDRKLRLFSCACCRHVWDRLSAADQMIVPLVEQWADGHFDLEELRRRLDAQNPQFLEDEWNDNESWYELRRRLRGDHPELLNDDSDQFTYIEQYGSWFPELLLLPNAGRTARLTSGPMLKNAKWIPLEPFKNRRRHIKPNDVGAWLNSWDEVGDEWVAASERAWEAELDWQVDILHDLFGNHFVSVSLDPSWLSWNGAVVPRLARCIYDERRFEDLPILGDALEEAGCGNNDILRHCRVKREHVRGCWVVDLLLGNK
jgi:hypothetical protein